jgi:hypothetical protein
VGARSTRRRSGLVIAYTFKRASQSYDKPDPVTEARIEEEREAA